MLEVGGVTTVGTPATCSLLVQREAWTTDLDLPAFAVRIEQASEVSSTDARSAACAVTCQIPLDCCLLQGRMEVAAGPFVV